MRLSAALSHTSVPVAPGGEAQVPVVVRNDGDTVEAYQIDVVGVPSDWVSVEPSTTTLYPATSGTVTVAFRPPRSAAVPAGEMPFGVRVVPVEHPDAAVLEEGVLTIEPFSELAPRLRPPTRSARIGARYRIDIDNRGNVPEQLNLVAEDSTKQLALSPATAEVTAPNDAVTRTRLWVRARRLLWWGEPRELLFTVHSRRADGLTDALDGRFVQQPIISPGLLKLLAALLALLLALLALWFGLLRPAVNSAAKEAADQVEAERKAQEAAVQTQPPEQPAGGGPSPDAGGGEPGGGAPGGGNGGPAAGGQGVTGQGGQFSAAISFRTLPNGSAARSYTVPAGKVFLLTDFLVDNVQGDEGTLQVSANGVRVVSLALENFRNQDYHSVTPIRVSENARVTLTVFCRRPGTPVNARAATSCSESLYLNGIMSDLPNP